MDEALATAWIILAIWLMTLVGGLLVLLAVWAGYGVMRHQDPASNRRDPDPASDEAAFVLPDRWPQDEETPELPHPRIGGDDGLSTDDAAALDERIMLLLNWHVSDDDVWRWIDRTMPPRHGPTDG